MQILLGVCLIVRVFGLTGWGEALDGLQVVLAWFGSSVLRIKAGYIK